VAAIGEFRSGRSSLVNALLGTAALPASFKVQIPYPVVISYASRPSLAIELIDRRRVVTDWDGVSRAPAHGVRRLHLGLPASELRSMRLIDTPACTSDGALLDERVLGLCRRADVVVWCTPAVQAWKASEQDAWLALPRRIRQRGILAVTYKDLIPSERDFSRLSTRLSVEAAQHFAEVVMVASIEAMQARQQQCDMRRRALWEASGGAPLAAAVSAVIAASRQRIPNSV
jgi:GTPase Era involved in 16S rRNA processing